MMSPNGEVAMPPQTEKGQPRSAHSELRGAIQQTFIEYRMEEFEDKIRDNFSIREEEFYRVTRLLAD